MTWHTINSEHSISSVELAEESSRTFCLDTYLSELVKSSNTRETCSCSDSETGSSQCSRYGTMCVRWMEENGVEQLTFFAEDSPVKTSAHKEPTTAKSSELMENAADFGRSMKGLLARCGLDFVLPKTPRCSALEGFKECSKGLPLWGMMLDGAVSEVARSVRITNENGFGSLPTVLATDWKGGCTAPRKDKGKQRLDQWRDYVKIKFGLTYPHPTHSELRMGWPEGWTDLKPLEMDKYLKWEQLHGKF